MFLGRKLRFSDGVHASGLVLRSLFAFQLAVFGHSAPHGENQLLSEEGSSVLTEPSTSHRDLEEFQFL